MKSTVSLAEHASAVNPTPSSITTEDALAIGSVLYVAHERARALVRQLELEAPSHPSIRALYEQSRDIQKGIATTLIAIAIEGASVDCRPSLPAVHRDRDCATCQVSVDRCELDAGLGQGRCCDGCTHA